MEKERKQEEFTSFVSGRSNAKRLALYIYVSIIEKNAQEVRLRSIGASAINQAVKAFIISKGKLAIHGVSPKLDIYFTDGDMKDIEEEKGSVIEMRITR